MSVVAYQRGGDPSLLTKQLPRDKDGAFSSLKCNFKNQTSLLPCQTAASNVDSYASPGHFDSQFSVQNSSNLAAFDVGFVRWKPITSIGLKKPPSVVDKGVIGIRKALERAYYEALYYVQNSKPLLGEEIYRRVFPKAGNFSADFLNDMAYIHKTAKINLDLLINGTPTGGHASDCYLHPDKCSTTFSDLFS